MALYEHPDGTWTISSHDVWLPGIYTSERAARLAFRLSNVNLSRIWEARRDAATEGADGLLDTAPLTYDDVLAALREQRED